MAGKALAIRLLGPVEARLGDVELPLESRLQKLILAVLALEPGTVVPVEGLVAVLWPADPPRTARATIQTAISHLQAVLADHAAIVGDGSGYRLDLTDAWTDVAAYQRVTQQAGASSDEVAVHLLTEAEALWRGHALDGVVDEKTRERLCHGLYENRLVATEDRFEAQLRLGRHGEILEELAAAVAARPLRERLVGQLMLAEHRCGRSQQALELFDRTAGRLGRDLGLHPSSRLEELRELIAHNAPQLRTPPPRPATELRPDRIPLPDPVFVGRAELLRTLDAAAAREPIVVLTGPGGIGKTQLALQWAERNREQFPDGRLYVDLRGYSPARSRRPVDVLAEFLRDLGTGLRQIPSDPDAAAAAYRAAVHGRRILIVLDNAVSQDQLEPLLPADAAATVLITSRDPMEVLLAQEDAGRVFVPPLQPQDSTELLGPGRGELAARCGHMPLALRVCGALVQAGDEADLPPSGQDPSLAVMQVAYSRLAPREQRTFRLLGLVPGTDVSTDAVTALTGLSADQTAAALCTLTELHLLTRIDEQHHALHDLVGQYAADLAAQDPESPAARGRLAGWYESAAGTATGLLFPQHRVVLPGTPQPETGRFAGNAAAMRWLEREFGNVVALITTCAQLGPRPASWRLAAALAPYLRTDIPAAPIRLIAAAAGSAAQVVEDLPGQAVANMTLAAAAKLDNEHEVTERHLRRARQLAQRAGWLSGEATALRLLGNLYGVIQRVRSAVRCCEESFGVYQQLGDLGGQAVNLHNSGMMYFLLGDLPHARQRAEQALAHYEAIGSLTGSAKALAALVQVDIREGCAHEALERAGRAVELAERSEDLRALEAALTTRAELQLAVGRYDEAESTVQRARSTGTNNPYTAIISAQVRSAIACANGSFGRALAEADAALVTARRLEATSFVDQLQLRRAAALLGMNDTAAALAEARAGLQTAKAHEFAILHAAALIEIAWIHLARGEFAEAADAARTALTRARRLGDRLGEAEAMLVLSVACRRVGRDGEAQRHGAAATARFDAMGIPVPERRLVAAS